MKQSAIEPFSILIPSWNNLAYLRLCVESIRRNSAVAHQIIVHVNDGSDGTLDYVRNEGLDFTHSPENVGVCLAMNMMRPLVKTNYVCYVNDDMYALPNWDVELWKEISQLPDNRFFLSSTTIQPEIGKSKIMLEGGYGTSSETFREADLLKEYMDKPMRDWSGATWPVNVVHRDIWDLVGGYSIEYTPGMYSDPDFTAKLWFCGVRYLKGVGNSRFYHFMSRSTNRIKKNKGSRQFLLKWGMTNKTFKKSFYVKNLWFNPAEVTSDSTFKIPRLQLLRCRLKAIAALALGKHFGPQKMPWE